MPSAPKSKKGVKIALISVAAAAVIAAIVLVLVFVVFAGDSGKAKELMDKGDAKMEEVQTKGEEVGAALNELIDSIDQVGTEADFNSASEDIRTQLEVLNDDLKSAEGSYREILGLNGVEEYKEYAEAILALVDNNFEIVRTITEYLDYLGGQYADADAGLSVDVDAISSTSAAFYTEMLKLGEESDELEGKALDIKQENGLE